MRVQIELKKPYKPYMMFFGQRHVCLARELTKQFESYIEGDITELIEQDFMLKGEFVIVVEGYQKTIDKDESPRDRVLEYIALGYDHKEAIKVVAKEMGVNKKCRLPSSYQ